MKTKSLFLLFFALLIFANLSAQESEAEQDSEPQVDCRKELSKFAQSAKIKDYDAAKPIYDKLVEHCEKVSMATYQYGERMFKHFMNEGETDADKKEAAENYIKNFEKRLELYPDKTDKGSTYMKMALAQFENKIGSTEDQYNAFDRAWKEDQENFINPKALYAYFSLLIDLQDEGKRTLQEAFDKYDEVMEKVNTEQAKRAKVQQPLLEKQDEEGKALTKEEQKIFNTNDIYLRNYNTIKESIDEKIGSRADCENLIPLYGNSFDEKKDDIDWLRSAARRLSSKKCTDGDLFFKITEALHKLDPSAKSAKYLGQLAANDGDNAKAIEYYKQSADLEDNELDKAAVYYLIGNMYKDQGSLSSARSFYRKTLSNDPSFGRAYLKIAQMYAASANDCGDNLFDKQAVYWKAAEYAKRAASVDPSLRSAAAQTAKSYEGRAPSKADIFKEGKEGEVINIKCWIGESVRVPNL